MDPRIVPLYYLCSIAGVVMVVGGIWLIYQQKIYIDAESKQVTISQQRSERRWMFQSAKARLLLCDTSRVAT